MEILKWRGIRFNDFTYDREYGKYWTQVCQSCVDEYQIPSQFLDEYPGYGIHCGVKGCMEEEADETATMYYLDIPKGEEEFETI